MNREIKFRVLDKRLNCIFPIIKLNKAIEGECEVDSCYYLNERNELEWLPLTEGLLMQYTGLKDVNGIEIYEGDIVKVTTRYYTDCSREELEDIEKTIELVVFEHYTFGFKSKGAMRSFAWISDFDCEVISNKYKNPILLKAVK